MARANDGRKTKQLCSQIGRAIDHALVGECEDEVLQNISVHSVEPAAGNRLLVTLTVHPPGSELGKDEVMRKLEAARGVLLDEVARSISRRSIPELTFWLVKAADDSPDAE